MKPFNAVAFRLVSRRWSALALVAAACSAAPAWAGPAGVPFKATVTASETLGYDPVRCPLAGIVGTTTGTGRASHLGAVRMVATDCPLLVPQVPPSFSDGRLTLTAANGDLLYASYQGQLIPVAGVADLYTIAGTYSVTGGTGRFAGASGSGSLQGRITLGPVTSEAEYALTGTLSY